MSDLQVTLGQRVQDTITGLKGIAVARATFLYGCVRVSVQPETAKDGKPAEACWFDEPQLVVLGDVLVPNEPVAPRHGPRKDAERRADAR